MEWENTPFDGLKKYKRKENKQRKKNHFSVKKDNFQLSSSSILTQKILGIIMDKWAQWNKVTDSLEWNILV
jgi:hypothetical protein